MRGKIALVRMYSEIANTTSVQIISPTFGVMRNDPLAASGIWTAAEGIALTSCPA